MAVKPLQPLQRHARLSGQFFSDQFEHVLPPPPRYILISGTDGCERQFCHLVTLPIIKDIGRES